MSTTRPPAYDERSSGQAESSRRGAHRARAKPVLAGLPVLAGILIVLAAAGGAWTVLGSGSTKDSSSVVGAVAGDDDPTPGATVPSAASSTAGSVTQQPTQPASSAATADPATSASTSPSGQTVDHSVSLVILNSVAVQGLAKRVATNLQPSGWTVARTDNSVQKNLSTTKVYYGSKSLRATAQALAKDLGFGTVVADSSVAKKGLVVVLGQDAV